MEKNLEYFEEIAARRSSRLLAQRYPGLLGNNSASAKHAPRKIPVVEQCDTDTAPHKVKA
jgi:hypothetical protein